MAEQEVVIVPYEDGPYLIQGPVVIRDQNGNDIPFRRRIVALCRCGRSQTRPFCDGTHRAIRFRAPSPRETFLAPEPGTAAGADA